MIALSYVLSLRAMSPSTNLPPPERRVLPREKCVHFRFKLRGGYDFQAVAVDATTGNAVFDNHYRDSLIEAASGYFEISTGMYEICDLRLLPLPEGRAGLQLRFVSKPVPPQTLDPQEFAYISQKQASLMKRHEQLQAMNQAGVKSVIALYTLMLLYAAAPFSSLHAFPGAGFMRGWGFGGLWLAMTAWFYCDRTFWRYGDHLFEQIFCMRQLFQMDKIAVGRSKLHNLYAILPSYGYSWDRAPSRATPSSDPTHLSRERMVASAWFFKLVSFFPLMYFFLFLSMFFFPSQLSEAKGNERVETYWSVALGFSFVFFLWLARSMKSCGELLQKAFLARRIGVESPWPEFPYASIDKGRAKRLKRRNFYCFLMALILSCVNFVVFIAWSLSQLELESHKATNSAASLIWSLSRLSSWFFSKVPYLTIVLGFVSACLFVYWAAFKDFQIAEMLRAAQKNWPTPGEAARRPYWVGRIPSFRLLSDRRWVKFRKLFFGQGL